VDLFCAGIEGTLPIEPWFIGGPVIKGFGRGSKVLGIPTGTMGTKHIPNSWFTSESVHHVALLRQQDTRWKFADTT
jgi:hypothetical protein